MSKNIRREEETPPWRYPKWGSGKQQQSRKQHKKKWEKRTCGRQEGRTRNAKPSSMERIVFVQSIRTLDNNYSLVENTLAYTQNELQIILGMRFAVYWSITREFLFRTQDRWDDTIFICCQLSCKAEEPFIGINRSSKPSTIN